MLDILRKHASSWMIKVLLGTIVISFIFFFGYSSMRRASRGAHVGEAVATVNGKPLSVAEYKFLLDNNYERLRQSFGGKEVPDFVRKMAQSSTLRQLITRELGLTQADEMGIVISDARLANAIMQTPYAQKDGEFDSIFYRHQFLPYFKERFGLNYENFVLEDLKLETLASMFENIDQAQTSNDDSDTSRVEYEWTFESITLDSSDLLESKAIKSSDETKDLAKLLISADPKKWKGMLSAFKITPTKIGPIAIRERKALLDGHGNIDDMTEIFGLTAEKPIIAKPIERGEKIYIVRLVEKKETKSDKSTFWPARNFFSSWMAKLSEKAKVQSFLQDSDQ
ncbi:MAG: SurA N-terminal domain-containing protein [Pseudomonadota bacterium]